MTSYEKKEVLLRQLCNCVAPTELITKSNFLSSVWESLTHLVDYHRNNELVAKAVKNNPDFVPRAFTLIVILYGAYSTQNNMASLFRDIVGLLDKDLKEEEKKVIIYSKSVQHPPFFRGLHGLWDSVNGIYANGNIGLILPQTPYLAFSLLALNHPEVIGKPVKVDELCERLLNLHEKMSFCLTVAQTSQSQAV